MLPSEARELEQLRGPYGTMNKTQGVVGVVVLLTAATQGQSQRNDTRPAGLDQSPIVLGGSQPSPGTLQRHSEPRIPYRYGHAISESIPPGTEAVTVLNLNPRPSLMPTPPGMSEIEFWTRQHDAVGIFRVTRITGQLTPAEDWIFSLVDADIIDILKPSAGGQLVSGQNKLTFRASGGTVRRGGVSITAATPSVEPFSVGSSYLIFLFEDPDDGILRTAEYFAFRVSDGTIERLDQRRGGPLQLPLAAGRHIEQIREYSKLPRVYSGGGAR